MPAKRKTKRRPKKGQVIYSIQRESVGHPGDWIEWGVAYSPFLYRRSLRAYRKEQPTMLFRVVRRHTVETVVVKAKRLRKE